MGEIRVNEENILFPDPKKKVPVEGDYHESASE
jgi:hypothetical protein